MRLSLKRNLVFVTGKGGVGKTTVAAALGLLAAERGRRTIVVEVGDQSRLPELFGVEAPGAGVETELADGFSSVTVDPDRVLLEWVQELGGRIPGKVLAGSSTFQYFAAAAPGAKELFAMVKIWELAQAKRWQRRARGYDTVVVDAPATGHALGMLASPRTFAAIARVGPVAGQADKVRDLLCDPSRSAFVAVALATDMAVSEVLELQEGIGEELGRNLDAVVVNGVLPRRFTPAELERIAALDGRGKDAEVRHAAAHAARAIHDRANFQHSQLTRLRRRGFEALGIPFAWQGHVDLDALEEIAERLGRRV